ncbi:MAG: hypothetical protein O2797_02160 [Bacteroidetes bacterium]|nr:hypothetical protein [Bacteroidota bacterium]
MPFSLHQPGLLYGATPYCGPAAISAVTGHDIETVQAWINHVRGTKELHTRIKGMTMKEAVVFFRRSSPHVKMHFQRLPSRPTLAAFLRDHSGPLPPALFSLTWGRGRSGHMVAVAGSQIADNLLGLDDLSTSRYRRSRVKSILWLSGDGLQTTEIGHPPGWTDPRQIAARTAFAVCATSKAAARKKASRDAKWSLVCPTCEKTCATYLRKPNVGDKYCMNCTKDIARAAGRNPGPRRNRIYDERTRLVLRQLR